MKFSKFLAGRSFVQFAFIALLMASGLVPVTAQAQAALTVSIADASTQEGNSGTKNLPFTVTLSRAATVTVTVRATTSNGTATSGTDYNGGALTVTFAPGETSKIGNVGIRGDTDFEADETFFVTLSNPTGGAVLGRAQATGTILNDDVGTDTTPDGFSFAPVTGAA
ncbi:Calx-beta domain-containing protein, partial [Nevskia sp.]|uniref:Calx-beta domain-containing protein n=1 Tax=Nevskia sp. TaxID=1929292 RepID=UPI003F6E9B96